jgi:pyruvate/2-oxoglutarate dehydrogenase complex dihydrolipoamide acyltransferase (E2) component
MPQMGERIAEGTITKWLVEVGSRVDRDQPLFEIATDKVDAEIPSPSSGVLRGVLYPMGSTVPVNTVVAWIEESVEANAEPRILEPTLLSAHTGDIKPPILGVAPKPGPGENHMGEQSTADSAKLSRLEKQIEDFKSSFWKQYKRTRRINNALVGAGIFLGACVTLAGFLEYGIVAGIGGVAITTLIYLQNAFNFAERANFYLVIHEEAKVLRDRLRYKVSSAADLGAVVDALGDLRLRAAKSIPKGKGMEAVKEWRS